MLIDMATCSVLVSPRPRTLATSEKAHPLLPARYVLPPEKTIDQSNLGGWKALYSVRRVMLCGRETGILGRKGRFWKRRLQVVWKLIAGVVGLNVKSMAV